MSLVSSQVLEDGSLLKLTFPDLLEIRKAACPQHLAERFDHHLKMADTGLVGQKFDLDPGVGGR